GADGLICVNQGVGDYMRSRYAPSIPLAVILNSVPYVARTRLAGRALRDLYPIPAGLRTILFAGSLRASANLAVTIRGFGLAKLDGWALAILGEGRLASDLAGLVRRLGLEGRVFLGKRVPQDELIAVASGADLGLIPYLGRGLNHQVATPNKLFEY